MNELPSGTVSWSLISGDLIGDFSELTNLEGLKSLESYCCSSNKKVLIGLWQHFTRLTQGCLHSFPLFLQYIICFAIFLLLKTLWRIFLSSKGQCLILLSISPFLYFRFFGGAWHILLMFRRFSITALVRRRKYTSVPHNLVLSWFYYCKLIMGEWWVIMTRWL